MLKLTKEQDFFGYHFKGRTYDTGSKEGFVEANVAFALWRNDIRNGVIDNISNMLKTIEPKKG